MFRKVLVALTLLIAPSPALLADEAPAKTVASVESKWEKEIAAFEAADREHAPPKNAIVFVGSSSIRLWKTLAEDFPEHKVINRGFGGSLIADSTQFADRIVIPYEPRLIVFYAGDNDIAADHSPDRVLADFKAFAEKIHVALPNARLCFIAIKPSIQRWSRIDAIRASNQRVAVYATSTDWIQYIDIATPMYNPDGMPRRELFNDDGLHLNREGYRLWTRIVKPYLKQ